MKVSPVRVFRWAKRPGKIYLGFDESHNVEEIHIGKPPKKLPDRFEVRRFVFFEEG